MKYLVQRYNEPKIYNDCEELNLKPLKLGNNNKSPTIETPTNNFFSKSRFGSLPSNQKNMYERDNSDEIYSPATESMILSPLSPDGTGSWFTKLNENTSGEEEWIGQEKHSYGRIKLYYFELY